MISWIDANPWLSVAICFAAGSLIGVALRLLRRGKYESREAPRNEVVA